MACITCSTRPGSGSFTREQDKRATGRHPFRARQIQHIGHGAPLASFGASGSISRRAENRR